MDTSGSFDWDYAIVKWSGHWAAYVDNDNSDILVHNDPLYNQGVSNVTWFDASPVNASPTPEPATILLLGSGLIGLAGLRKFFLNK